MANRAFVYGCYGYTGVLIVREAIEKGVPIVIGGRNREKCEALAKKHGLDVEKDVFVFNLDDEKAVDDAFTALPDDVTTVMSVAGPYSETFDIMIGACLKSKLHYLDVTGEIEVFEKAFHLDSKAKEAGITILPGCGLDVVPTDCLAAHLKQRMPDAVSLELAFGTLGAVESDMPSASRGTMRTMMNGLGKSTLHRKDGEIVPISYGSRKIPFTAEKSTPSTLIPWGDVSTAYHSTGIPNIKCYMMTPGSLDRTMWWASFSFVRWILRSLPQSWKEKAIPEWGPTEESFKNCKGVFWGEVTNSNGDKLSSRCSSLPSYPLTAVTAVEMMKRLLLENDPEKHGFQTPSTMFGANFICEADATAKFEDIE